jgi:hypothetical protein
MHLTKNTKYVQTYLAVYFLDYNHEAKCISVDSLRLVYFCLFPSTSDARSQATIYYFAHKHLQLPTPF